MNMVTKNELTKEVIEIIADLVELEPSEINDDTLLIDEIGVTSLTAIEISFRIEESWGLEVPEENLDKWKTPNDIVETVLGHLTKTV